MRIKLNFTDVQDYSESFLSKSWFLLDPDNVKTVADLAKELIRRFGLKCKSGSLQLTLDDSLLPDWESTRILRDDDTVRFVCYFVMVRAPLDRAVASDWFTSSPYVSCRVQLYRFLTDILSSSQGDKAAYSFQ